MWEGGRLGGWGGGRWERGGVGGGRVGLRACDMFGEVRQGCEPRFIRKQPGRQ